MKGGKKSKTPSGAARHTTVCLDIWLHTDVFIKVVESVLTADKFQLRSPAATTTKEIAVAVIQWSKEETHTEQQTAFVKYLEAQLRDCCDVKSSSGQLKKEKLWGLYHQKRTSNPKQLSCKKVCGPQKGYGEKRCEIQGGGQEMDVMVG